MEQIHQAKTMLYCMYSSPKKIWTTTSNLLVVQESEIILWKAVCCNFSPTYTQRRFSAQCEKCQRKLLYMQLALMDGQSHETTICIFVISTLNLVFNLLNLNMMHILHLKHIHRWSSFPVISFLFLQTSEGVTHTLTIYLRHVIQARHNLFKWRITSPKQLLV